jgi:uncharacterized protein
MNSYRDEGTVFSSAGNELVGIISRPERVSSTGVLVLVGGPQYRVGSHRHFTLLSRGLADQGIAVMRFDYAGMGDSAGERKEFHEVEEDIRAAIAHFMDEVPELQRIVLWGLCDAASAAMMYAWKYPEVAALVLLNPWVHLGDYSPEVKLSHYYAPLLKGRETWQRIFTGKINVVPALKEFVGDSTLLLKKAAGSSVGMPMRHPFVRAMLEGLEKFSGNSQFVVSGQDLTAREFVSLADNDHRWQSIMNSPAVTVGDIAEADHTFSQYQWQQEVLRLTLQLVHSAEN